MTLPRALINLGFEAFDGCSRLRYVTIPETLKYIGREVFYRCDSLECILCPSSIVPMLADSHGEDISVKAVYGFWDRVVAGEISDEEMSEWLEFIRSNASFSLRVAMVHGGFCRFVLENCALDIDEIKDCLEHCESIECRAVILDHLHGSGK